MFKKSLVALGLATAAFAASPASATFYYWGGSSGGYSTSGGYLGGSSSGWGGHNHYPGCGHSGSSTTTTSGGSTTTTSGGTQVPEPGMLASSVSASPALPLRVVVAVVPERQQDPFQDNLHRRVSLRHPPVCVAISPIASTATPA